MADWNNQSALLLLVKISEVPVLISWRFVGYKRSQILFETVNHIRLQSRFSFTRTSYQKELLNATKWYLVFTEKNTCFRRKRMINGFDFPRGWCRRRSVQYVRRNIIAIRFAILNRSAGNRFAGFLMGTPAVTWLGVINYLWENKRIEQGNEHTCCFVTLDSLVFIIHRTFGNIHALSPMFDFF